MTGTIVALFLIIGTVWWCWHMYDRVVRPELPERKPKPVVVPPEDNDDWGDYVGGGRR